MILTQHGMNSIDLGGGGGGDTVEIGGKVYRAVQMPDGNIWLGENLDYQFPGCVIGASGDSDTEPRGNYYDNDEELWGWNGRKCGLLYNYPAVQYMNDHCGTLFPGWHVATNTEWNDLDGALGGYSGDSGSKISAVRADWMVSSWRGTDDYGFTGLPGGDYGYGSFYGGGEYAEFWTGTEGDYAAIAYTATESYIQIDYNELFVQYYVRLVKD